MQKISVLLLAVLLIFSLLGCAGSPDPSESPADIANEYIGEDLSELISVIGQPDSTQYQDSCEIVDAQDGFLYYDGFTVITCKTDDEEIVQSVRSE